MKHIVLSLICLTASVIGTSSVSGSDWPTYLHDKERTGATTDTLKLPLKQAWVYDSPSMIRRAWSGPEGRVVENKELRDRVKFDDAFQVAVANGRLYFGSSVDHQVHCRDAVTGKELWRFFTGGPIRLAPTVTDGRVYVGSDDGMGYCLDAKDGHLIWKLRLGPADEWIIARGELISRWPVRTGVLVDEGVAYFGAGIFPHENVYLCAVDAVTGDLLWRNDHISHSDAGRNDLSPQGYLLATGETLYVPSSRSRPRAVNRITGQLAGAATTSLKLANTIIAGTDGLIADDRLHTYSLGTRLAVSGESSFAATGTELMRMNRKAFASALSKQSKLSSELRTLSGKLRKPESKEAEAEYKARIAEIKEEIANVGNEAIDWRTPCTAEAGLIIAGNLVFAGDHNLVTAFEIETGKEVWKTEIDGQARGLAVSNSQLFVSTTSGKIYGFSDATSPKSAATVISSKPAENPFPKDELSTAYEKAAQEILANAKPESGYCLIVGSEHGRLAYEVAKQSTLKVYCIEPNAKKVAVSRDALASAGIYGSRVTVHQRDPNAIPYSNYFANLIVSETQLLGRTMPGLPAELVNHLKPAGGAIVLGQSIVADQESHSAAKLRSWVEELRLDDQSSVSANDGWVTLTRGTLPGAGNWSHQYGEPGNSASSGDKLVQGGLGVLWYGDPGPDKMVNRHQGAVGPLVVNGRMFVQGTDSLMAYDAYNGAFLWEEQNPTAVRTGVFQNVAPGNLAASDDSLFHMIREKVIEHDAATGKVIRIHELPESVDRETHEWGYVAYRDGLLIGTATVREIVERARRRRGRPGADATDAIFAIDTKTGKHLWTYHGKSIAHHTIALGPSRVFLSTAPSRVINGQKFSLKTRLNCETSLERPPKLPKNA